MNLYSKHEPEIAPDSMVDLIIERVAAQMQSQPKK